MTDILEMLRKKAREIHAGDPLLKRGIGVDWVCVINPAQVHDLIALVPEWSSGYGQDHKLRQVTGRKTFILNSAPSDHIEYMTELAMYARYRDELFATYNRDTARFEIPARSQAVLCVLAGINRVKFAISRLRSRRDIQRMRLERITREEIDDAGHVKVDVYYSPLAIQFILDHYDDKDGLLHLSRFDDHSLKTFKDLPLLLDERAQYVGLIRIKPAFTIYDGKRLWVESSNHTIRLQEKNRFNSFDPHMRAEPTSPLFLDNIITEIEIGTAGIDLTSHNLEPFDDYHLRREALKIRAMIERGELQKVKRR